MTVSVLVLTYNEEHNLSRCLSSLGWSDDVVVLDSDSTDGTLTIAEKFGVRVYQHTFENYANQRNFGLGNIAYRHPWLLMVDADEVVTPSLAKEISQVVSHNLCDVTLYRMRRKDYFREKWLRRSSGYPTWFGRLMKIGCVSIEREINEEFLTDGKVGFLREHLLHYPFNKGMFSWLEKHNRYSSMEAELLSKANTELRLSNFFSKDPALRRKFQKNLVYSLPGRSVIVFFLFYVARGGFLDGRAGLMFCTLRAFYEYLIKCKLKEIESRNGNQPF